MFNLFQYNTTIWICTCCGARYWINADHWEVDKEFKCINCGHANQMANYGKNKEKE